MVGRIGRIGADSVCGCVAWMTGDGAGDDALGGDEDARAGGLVALPLGDGGGARTVTSSSSPETSSTELSRVTVTSLLTVMSSP